MHTIKPAEGTAANVARLDMWWRRWRKIPLIPCWCLGTQLCSAVLYSDADHISNVITRENKKSQSYTKYSMGVQGRWIQALFSDTRARCSINKLEHKRFHVNIRKHFLTVQVMGALAQVAWRGSGVSLLGELQKPLGHCPGHPALVGLLKQGRGQMDPEVPASLCHSVRFRGISGAWICKDTCVCNDYEAQLCSEGNFVELILPAANFCGE